MENLKSIYERKRQDVCEGCGRAIENQEKECTTCGRFPHKAYHERAAASTLGIAKWLQTGPAMQPNQKLRESDQPGLENLISFGDFNS
jgi:hypothetical protein